MSPVGMRVRVDVIVTVANEHEAVRAGAETA